MSMMRNRYARLAMIAGVVVLADQLTKMMVLGRMTLHESIAVIPGFFHLTYIHNPGGAFGFLADQSPGLRSTLFLFVSSLSVGLLLWFYRNTPRSHPWLSFSIALILGGALGNLIDRIRFGHVVDFLDFFIGNLHWPAFNAADSAITVGVCIFIVHIVFGKLPEENAR